MCLRWPQVITATRTRAPFKSPKTRWLRDFISHNGNSHFFFMHFWREFQHHYCHVLVILSTHFCDQPSPVKQRESNRKSLVETRQKFNFTGGKRLHNLNKVSPGDWSIKRWTEGQNCLFSIINSLQRNNFLFFTYTPEGFGTQHLVLCFTWKVRPMSCRLNPASLSWCTNLHPLFYLLSIFASVCGKVVNLSLATLNCSKISARSSLIKTSTSPFSAFFAQLTEVLSVSGKLKNNRNPGLGSSPTDSAEGRYARIRTVWSHVNWTKLNFLFPGTEHARPDAVALIHWSPSSTNNRGQLHKVWPGRRWCLLPPSSWVMCSGHLLLLDHQLAKTRTTTLAWQQTTNTCVP